MLDLVFDIADRNGRGGQLRIAGGIWIGDECVFEFAETLHGSSGAARCDWRQPGPRFELVHGNGRDPEVQATLAQVAELLRAFHRGVFVGVGDEALQRIYRSDYHAGHNYSNGSEFETRYKARIVDSIVRLFQPQKLLDAGCSAGEVVRQLRARGVDAHGFDLCPDLDDIAFAEVRGHVRRGSVTAIPYGPEDGFDTLTAFDVFEHIPEDRLPAMVDEFARLGVRRVIALIALCEFQYPEHLTLRPLSWWDRVLAPRFRRCQERRVLAGMASDFAAEASKYLAVYELVQVPALV